MVAKSKDSKRNCTLQKNNCLPFPSARRCIISFKSQANVAQTNSLMWSYCSRRCTISFLRIARAMSIKRRSPRFTLTRHQDFNHLSALPMSLVSTEREGTG